MPLGSMLPHGKVDPSTGVPMWRFHATLPSLRSAYTVLFSVAAMTSGPFALRRTSGLAYNAPSSFAVAATFSVVTAGTLPALPVRALSW
jgi:hypothetical protein